MTAQVFAPGCALYLYKPELAAKVLTYLNKKTSIPEYSTCCQHSPQLPPGTCVINTCPGCDRRYRSQYEGITTISLWEFIKNDPEFPFPDYKGREISVHDACPVRSQPVIHNAVRQLLEKMNLRIIETPACREKSVCCGDSLYDAAPLEKVISHMQKRAASMPCGEVAVYCVSCIKSMAIGGKTPLYLIDLLFDEQTEAGDTDLDRWHAEIDAFMEKH